MGSIWSSILVLLCRNAETCLSTYIYFIANRYVQACHKVLQTDSLKLDQFSKELLPSLLTLSMDKIPNVRISVAQLISQCLLPLGNVASMTIGDSGCKEIKGNEHHCLNSYIIMDLE